MPRRCRSGPPHLHRCCARPGPAGTNGCSQKPLAVLKSEVPTNENAFVSPDAYSVVLTESAKSLVSCSAF